MLQPIDTALTFRFIALTGEISFPCGARFLEKALVPSFVDSEDQDKFPTAVRLAYSEIVAHALRSLPIAI